MLAVVSEPDGTNAGGGGGGGGGAKEASEADPFVAALQVQHCEVQ